MRLATRSRTHRSFAVWALLGTIIPAAGALAQTYVPIVPKRAGEAVESHKILLLRMRFVLVL